MRGRKCMGKETKGREIKVRGAATTANRRPKGKRRGPKGRRPEAKGLHSGCQGQLLKVYGLKAGGQRPTVGKQPDRPKAVGEKVGGRRCLGGL